ncbi:DUF1294 domain-containing protein [Clostridiaceae bacterium UIB06]|uniref:DUF1294 domain-containing protein n=1 Tax=Clostridium thailandense TaxID=2794346 RepID=A0A949X2D8_9CLOT|nr:DUF1294 domain-containing protein [Clostridium thailandense]MBV7273124.1 DUF1294 domain-containing protein [Clostridium thailandense]MCH5137550.1 DUF1294 domain-containing protein [Clostridiaceae bacterium UIB06]
MKILLYYILIINLYGILIMYCDKNKSIKKQWRVPEARIFLISFILGSLGVILGMYLFRHKTKHMKFTLGIPLIFIIQVYFLSKFAFHLF